MTTRCPKWSPGFARYRSYISGSSRLETRLNLFWTYDRSQSKLGLEIFHWPDSLPTSNAFVQFLVVHANLSQVPPGLGLRFAQHLREQFLFAARFHGCLICDFSLPSAAAIS